MQFTILVTKKFTRNSRRILGELWCDFFLLEILLRLSKSSWFSKKQKAVFKIKIIIYLNKTKSSNNSIGMITCLVDICLMVFVGWHLSGDNCPMTRLSHLDDACLIWMTLVSFGCCLSHLGDACLIWMISWVKNIDRKRKSKRQRRRLGYFDRGRQKWRWGLLRLLWLRGYFSL